MSRFELSISSKHKKVMDILDAWRQKGNAGDKICRLIEKAYEEENKGNKLDSYSKETKPLDLFPKVTEEWTPDKLQQYNVKDIQRVVSDLYKRRQEISSYLNQLAKLR